MVVNLVQAQINQATCPATLGGTSAWASQPGAIRVFDPAGDQQIYRLYSANTLTTPNTPTAYSLLSTDLPSTSYWQNWLAAPSVWVDLNAPVPYAISGTTGNQVAYPILDPRNPSGGDFSNGTALDGFQVNPGVIGLTGSTQIAAMPVQWLYVLQDGTIVPPDLSQPGTAGTTVVLTGTAATATNPIVGRIAFWTDDDTCRLNINTAGDGTFWDSPRFSGNDEIGTPTNPGGFAAGGTLIGGRVWCQPANWEYQRYPGHPAMTSLLPVLNAVNPTAFPATNGFPASGLSPYSPTTGTNPYLPTAYTNLFGTGTNSVGVNMPGLCPRYAYGGSQEGTIPVKTAMKAPANDSRLYASVGELLFSSSSATTSSPTARTATLLTRQQLETAKFFLTAHSRAPELNLRGQPRVSMWPINPGAASISASQPVPINSSGSAPPKVTPTDQLLAFCSTVSGSTTGPIPYYFMRTSSINATTDIGLSVNLNGSNVLQNQAVLNYLDYLTSEPIPGFGGVFQSPGKYGQLGMRQILAEMFDYIRTTNVEDGNVNSNYKLNDMSNPSVYAVMDPAFNGGFGAGYSNVVPSLISPNVWTLPSTTAFTGTLQGFGTFPRPISVTFQFAEVGRGPGVTGTGPTDVINVAAPELSYVPYTPQNALITTATDGSGTGVVKAGCSAIQSFVSVDFINPAAGRIMATSPAFWIEMKGLDSLQVNGINLGFQPVGRAKMIYEAGLPWISGAYGNDQFQGKVPGYAEFDYRAAGPYIGGNSWQSFPFYSQITVVPNTSNTGTMILSSAASPPVITVNLYDTSNGASGPGNLIQTFSISLTGSALNSFPIPCNTLVSDSNHRIIGTGYNPYNNTNNQAPCIGDWPDATTPTGQPGPPNMADRWLQAFNNIIDPSDVMESFVLSPQWRDARMLAVSTVPSSAFQPHQNWGQQWAYDWTFNSGWLWDNKNWGWPVGYTQSTTNPRLTSPMTGDCFPGSSGDGSLVALPSNAPPYYMDFPAVSSTVNGVNFVGGSNGTGDWDTGISRSSDGPWINRADEGGAQVYPLSMVLYVNGSIVETGSDYIPYCTGGNGTFLLGGAFFSPNREIPSPGMFGSLPTGVDPTGANPSPWQTLLFRPGPPNHPGSIAPFDHLLLDLFWMPVAEPYAISEPFSTAGKVNLNYQILPFGYVSETGTTPYIKRDTAVRAALAPEMIAEVSNMQANLYKNFPGNWDNQWTNELPGSAQHPGYARFPINLDETLKQFDSLFTTGSALASGTAWTPVNFFRSASEICNIYLVPQEDPANSTLSTFSNPVPKVNSWYGGDFALVGDNVRERPYTDLYSRLTTKSNTFTVYFTVQELKNSPTVPPNHWNEGSGSVVGEYRGSVDLERYLQQNTNIPNFLTNPTLTGTTSLESSYRWRVLENNQFAP